MRHRFAYWVVMAVIFTVLSYAYQWGKRHQVFWRTLPAIFISPPAELR